MFFNSEVWCVFFLSSSLRSSNGITTIIVIRESEETERKRCEKKNLQQQQQQHSNEKRQCLTTLHLGPLKKKWWFNYDEFMRNKAKLNGIISSSTLTLTLTLIRVYCSKITIYIMCYSIINGQQWWFGFYSLPNDRTGARGIS